MAVATRKNRNIINGTTVRSRFQRTLPRGRVNSFYRRRARRKEARVSFNNYERLNVSRAANTKDLIYNDGWFNWIEQLRSYKITTRNNCGVVVSSQPSRGVLRWNRRWVVTPGAFTSHVKYWRVVHKSKFHSRGMELLHFSGCVLVVDAASKRLLLSREIELRLIEFLTYSNTDRSIVVFEIKIPIKEQE